MMFSKLSNLSFIFVSIFLIRQLANQVRRPCDLFKDLNVCMSFLLNKELKSHIVNEGLHF